jgi:hypothetical protein
MYIKSIDLVVATGPLLPSLIQCVVQGADNLMYAFYTDDTLQLQKLQNNASITQILNSVARPEGRVPGSTHAGNTRWSLTCPVNPNSMHAHILEIYLFHVVMPKRAHHRVLHSHFFRKLPDRFQVLIDDLALYAGIRSSALQASIHTAVSGLHFVHDLAPCTHTTADRATIIKKCLHATSI